MHTWEYLWNKLRSGYSPKGPHIFPVKRAVYHKDLYWIVRIYCIVRYCIILQICGQIICVPDLGNPFFCIRICYIGCISEIQTSFVGEGFWIMSASFWIKRVMFCISFLVCWSFLKPEVQGDSVSKDWDSQPYA